MKDFDEYIRWRGAKQSERDQIAWTHDSQGTQLVNFIGQYENLKDDFGTICKMVGISAVLGQENTSSHKDYRSYYTDETAKIVEALYKRDCALFGYSFDSK